MVNHNTTRAAERSSVAFEQLLDTLRVLGYAVIRDVLVKNPPIAPGMIVDPLLIVTQLLNKLEQEYAKREFQRRGNNEYIISTDTDEPKRFS